MIITLKLEEGIQFMDQLKKLFMKYFRWVIIAICAYLILFFDKTFPNVVGDQRTLISTAIAIPFILCVLTIRPEELVKRKKK